jgi:S-(hydroxymethyl)glutathione dehydrogenase/alcohol dehydrogenase
VLLEAGTGTGYTVEELELDPPREGEVLVRLAAAGLCHTDELLDTGEIPAPVPRMVAGHEGAGVVEAVGAGVQGLRLGDHVVVMPPACGRCPDCASGHSHMCALGAGAMLTGASAADGSLRRRTHNGDPVGAFIGLGTFAERCVVSDASVVRIPEHVPLRRAALVACGVATGWGAAVRTGETGPGDAVVVVGVGGVGINAVQGARMAGARLILAVDPSAWKRSRAPEFGATHTAATVEQAATLLRDLTGGRMADRAIIAAGSTSGALLARTVALTGRRGITVLTSGGDGPTNVPLMLTELIVDSKQIRGCTLGGINTRVDVPTLLDLCERGDLLLDELITKTYALEEINDGYRDIRDGEILRAQIAF